MENLRLFGRIAVAGVIVLVLMLALVLVRSLVSERAQFRDEAVASVAASRAGEQVLVGPLRVIPWSEERLVTESDGDRVRVVRGHQVQMPQQLQVDGQLLPEQRRVGMFNVPVYTWRGKLAARYAPLVASAVPGRVYGQPYLVMGISDVRGLVGTPGLLLNGQPARLQAGSLGLDGISGGVHVPLQQDAQGHVPAATLSLELVLDGTRSLSVVPVADDNRVQMASRWPHPSFVGGAFLPAQREVSDAGFRASWAVSSLASKAQQQVQQAMAQGGGLSAENIHVSLVDPVDVYTQSLRAAKYGVLFIVLTFVGFGIYDLVKGLNLHPLQYLLVGLALVMFFLLLLSLSEQMPFLLAYLLASAACIALQAWYLSAVLHSGWRALGFASLLTALYAALYGLLVSEQNALLLGSLLLFAVLAAVMGLTRKLDWRQLGRRDG